MSPDEQREQRALAALDRFIKENAHDLLAIAHWGDGCCGFITETIWGGLIDHMAAEAEEAERKAAEAQS